MAFLALCACTTVPKQTQQTSLEGTYWRAVELPGRPTLPRDAVREAHLQFQADDRVSGSDGCNQITGSYSVQGDRITFAHIAATQMACLDSPGTQVPFREALESAAQFVITDDVLDLFDGAGSRVALFQAGGEGSGTSSGPAGSPGLADSSGLAGTGWQLLRFKGSDGATLAPGDPAKYTIEFGAEGRLSARIDCNRGQGTWTVADNGQISFGPLASTRAECPPGSFYDQIARRWSDIRSYSIRNGHLFLGLTADGGVYEFEPAAAVTP